MKLEINKYSPVFTLFAYVALAIDLKHDNERYRLLSIQGGELAGTNGHRMHIAQLSEEYPYDDGLYEVIKRTKTELVLLKTDRPLTDFPVYRQCVPKTKEEAIPTEATASGYARLIRAMHPDFTINYQYFQDAASYGGDVYPEGATKASPILFKAELFQAQEGRTLTMQAVVMPLKM